jgi:SAM-dependent methyltransferase
MVSAETAAEWVGRWDAQQQRYVADREERFAVIGDVVAHATAGQGDPLVLDLGCGPGSLSARLAQRLPGARVIGIDRDPVLLGLARSRYPGAGMFVDADLGTPGWVDALDLDGPVDAVVSTTALHWLPVPRLAELYRALAAVLRPGGVLVNGDHLGEEQPALAELVKVVRDARAVRAGVLGNEDWATWWQGVAADPELVPLVAERERRAPHGGEENGLSLAGHAELLRAAGFSEVGTVWRVGDDVVAVAVR